MYIDHLSGCSAVI